MRGCRKGVTTEEGPSHAPACICTGPGGAERRGGPTRRRSAEGPSTESKKWQRAPGEIRKSSSQVILEAIRKSSRHRSPAGSPSSRRASREGQPPRPPTPRAQPAARRETESAMGGKSAALRIAPPERSEKRAVVAFDAHLIAPGGLESAPARVELHEAQVRNVGCLGMRPRLRPAALRDRCEVPPLLVSLVLRVLCLDLAERHHLVDGVAQLGVWGAGQRKRKEISVRRECTRRHIHERLRCSNQSAGFNLSSTGRGRKGVVPCQTTRQPSGASPPSSQRA